MARTKEEEETTPKTAKADEEEERISIETQGDTFVLVGNKSGVIKSGIATRQEAISEKAKLLGRDDPYNPKGDEVPASFATQSTLDPIKGDKGESE